MMTQEAGTWRTREDADDADFDEAKALIETPRPPITLPALLIYVMDQHGLSRATGEARRG